ncbi:MAG: FkbM family methyltransferase [Lachnospiraceae bacterium]|nr:FkbM family methyltransferase [Lachnospiraceae bacterium]
MRTELIQLHNIIDAIASALNFASQGETSVLPVLSDGIATVNAELFGCPDICEASVPLPVQNSAQSMARVREWIAFVTEELNVRSAIGNQIDYDFHCLISHIRIAGYDFLVQEMRESMLNIRTQSEENYHSIQNIHNAYAGFWGMIDIDNGVLDLFENRAFELTEHLDEFIWLYHELADYRSKKVLYGIMHFWLTFDYDIIGELKESNFSDYFDHDLIKCSKDEVFVDLGAYTGDSALSFIDNFGNYKRLYLYEITPETIDTLKENMKLHDNVIIRNVGVGESAGTMYLNKAPRGSHSNQMSDSEGVPVPVVCLDEDIQEPITFLKMDIEGSELLAINGAKKHIQNDKPKLAICSYHNNHHIWELPKRMRELNPDYKLYMRYNGYLGAVFASEYVTFGI